MSHSLQPVFAAAKGVDCNPRPRPPLPPDVNFLMRFSLSLAHQQNELKFVCLASKLRARVKQRIDSPLISINFL